MAGHSNQSLTNSSVSPTPNNRSISPTPELKAQLTPDLEAIGRALNSRIRKRFNNVKHRGSLTEAEKRASRADRALPPIPAQRGGRLTKEAQAAAEFVSDVASSVGPYRIVVGSIATTSAYEVLVRQGQLTLVLNDRHPFFRDLYEPLATAAGTAEPSNATFLALTVLAAARAEASAGSSAGRAHLPKAAWRSIPARAGEPHLRDASTHATGVYPRDLPQVFGPFRNS